VLKSLYVGIRIFIKHKNKINSPSVEYFALIINYELQVAVQTYAPKVMEKCQRIYGTRDDLTLAGIKKVYLKLSIH